MKRVRYRYIVFEIKGAVVAKRDLINSLNDLWRGQDVEDAEKLWLVYFKNNVGIVRCRHTDKERAVSIINDMKSIGDKKVEIRSVGASGTIKAALTKYVK